MTLINPEITPVGPEHDRGLGRLPEHSGHPRPGAALARRSACSAFDRTGKRDRDRRRGLARARDPARDRSSRRRAVLRSDGVVRVADLHGRVRPLLDRADDDEEEYECSTVATRSISPRRAGGGSRRTSPTSTGRSSRWSTCPRRSRARCSRATRARPKSLRRLFLDEFVGPGADGGAGRRRRGGRHRARRAALRSACSTSTATTRSRSSAASHLACEDASNVLTKVLEWGRLMAYLEQSTRYVPVHRSAGRPLALSRARRARRAAAARRSTSRRSTRAFETYARVDPADAGVLRARATRKAAGRFRRPSTASAIRAKALDTLRGLLPAATQSNVGIYGTGQAYEALLLRMRAHPLAEVARLRRRDAGRAAQGHPGVPRRASISPSAAALERVPGRHASATSRAAGARRSTATRRAAARDEVTLTDFDPDGEVKVVAAALYAVSRSARRSAAGDRAAHDRRRARRRCCAPTSASATNRRHKPGRAFERTQLPLRRPHRLRRVPRSAAPSAAHARVAAAVAAARLHASRRRSSRPAAHADWRAVMDRSAELHDALVARGLARRRAVRRGRWPTASASSWT